MSYYLPFTLTVDFPDDSATVERLYSKGASDAVDNMAKAIEYYERKKRQCAISLRDNKGNLIIRYQTEPEK